MVAHSYLNLALLSASCSMLILATSQAAAVAQTEVQAEPTSVELIGEAAHYQDRDEYTAALDTYKQAAALAEAQRDKRSLARAQLGEGEVYYLQTKFVHAVAVLNKSVTLSAQADDRPTEAWANNWLGYVYYRLYYYDSAEHYLRQALLQFEQQGDRAAQAIVTSNLGRLIDAVGVLPEDASRSDLSRRVAPFHERALTFARASGDKGAISYALNNYGNSLNDRDWPKAIAAYQEAYDLAAELKQRRRMVITLGNLARGLVSACNTGEEHVSQCRQQQTFDRAIAQLTSAIALAESIEADEELWELYMTLSYARLRNTSASADLSGARAALEKSIEVVERMRLIDDGDELARMRYFNGRTAPYQALIRVLAPLGDFQKLLRVAEQAKARTLLTLMHQAAMGQESLNTGVQTQANMLQLQTKLAELNAAILRTQQSLAPDAQLLASLTSQRQRLQQQKFDLQAQSAPPTASANLGFSPSPLTSDDLAALVPDEQTAILYMAWDSQTSLVITRGLSTQTGMRQETLANGLQLSSYYLLGGPSAFEAELFRRQLQTRDAGYKTLARKFYDYFIAPASPALAGKTKLIIIADLWDFPFQALLSPAGRYLLEDFKISYAPSLTALREVRQRARTESAPQALLALGNPALPRPTVALVKRRFRDAQLEPLPEAEREVAGLSRFYTARGSDVLIGPKAGEQVFKNMAGNYRVIHLATHGIVNNENPFFSALLMAQTGQGDDDGLLEAWEIMSLKLNADLVILSACDTANGRPWHGEGMTGLAWAFMVAGVPTAVVSQWKVESNATADLMIEFHRGLTQDKLSKAAALRQAALKLMRQPQTRHPFYWAGFVVMGDGQ